MYNQINKYAKAGQLVSVSKSKRIILLYEGCISFIKKTQQAIINGNIQDKFNYITKTCKIIEGFRLSLDYEKAGEVAQVLDSFYAQIYLKITRLNFEKDLQKNVNNCDIIVKELEEVLSSWQLIDKQLNDKNEVLKKDPDNFSNRVMI